MATTPDPIRASIDTFLSDIQALTRAAALDAVQAVLAGEAPSSGTSRRRNRRGAPKARRATKRGKRTTQDVQAVAAKVLGYVKSNAGQRLEEIGRGLRVETQGLKLPIQKLIAERKLRTTGQKRGTKYFAGGAARAMLKPAKKSKRRTAKRRAAKKTARAAPAQVSAVAAAPSAS
jgi:hypothetical protein